MAPSLLAGPPVPCRRPRNAQACHHHAMGLSGVSRGGRALSAGVQAQGTCAAAEYNRTSPPLSSPSGQCQFPAVHNITSPIVHPGCICSYIGAMQHSLQAGSVAGAECSLRQCPRAQRPRASCTMHAIRRQGLAMRATSSGLLQRASRLQRRQQQRLDVQATYPEPETEKVRHSASLPPCCRWRRLLTRLPMHHSLQERSPIDYPQEWITPQPSRRPDIFPEFEKLQTPLPKPMPGDPEVAALLWRATAAPGASAFSSLNVHKCWLCADAR